jgi:hypothetical protein
MINKVRDAFSRWRRDRVWRIEAGARVWVREYGASVRPGVISSFYRSLSADDELMSIFLDGGKAITVVSVARRGITWGIEGEPPKGTR